MSIAVQLNETWKCVFDWLKNQKNLKKKKKNVWFIIQGTGVVCMYKHKDLNFTVLNRAQQEHSRWLLP